MRTFLLILITSLGTFLSISPAETTDPSEFFLGAYMSYQKGEKAENSGDFNNAMAAYKQAQDALDSISRKWPSWSPPIVKHRRDRAVEAITRIQPRIPKIAVGSKDDDLTGALPTENLSLIPEDLQPAQPQPKEPPTARPVAKGADPIREIQDRLESLQNDLEQTRVKLKQVTDEKAELAKRYDSAIKEAQKSTEMTTRLQARADLAEQALMKAESEGAKSAGSATSLRAEVDTIKKQLRNVQIDREAGEELRMQLADRLAAAKKRIDSVSEERDLVAKANAELPGKLAAMQKQIDSANVKANRSEETLKKVTVERDDAFLQIARLKEAEKQVEKLLGDNTALMVRLGEAEKSITLFKSDGAKKDEQIASLKKDLNSATKQLADTKKDGVAFQQQMTELQARLDAQSKELLKVKSDAGVNIADRKKLSEENDMLRGIVVREMKEHARRSETKKLVLGELQKLELQSKSLLKQIDYLGQPVVKLTEKESRLFKKPLIEISDAEISIAAPKEPTEGDPVAAGPGLPPAEASAELEADLGSITEPATTASTPAAAPAATTETAAPPAEPAKPDEKMAKLETTPKAAGNPPVPSNDDLPAKSPGETTPAEPTVETGPAPNVPPELLGWAREAKELFERGNYRDAEKVYDRILAKAPNNLYALSNLGVARFRNGKLKLAEESFKKAIAIAPEDGFAHCTLGVIYYSEGKYDEAVNSLTKALAIQPKNAIAHNYLGITASQKGWQEAAVKELEAATALDTNYADAFFNLAVAYATLQPPNKELARKHYKRATQLGAEPDPALEQLIK